MAECRRKIVVGVVDQGSRHVVETAACYASRFDADLVCSMIVPDPYGLGEAPAGYLGMMRSIADDDDAPLEIPPAIETMIDEIASARGVKWAPYTSVGSPARELAELSDRIDALMIVLGTRKGVRGMVREALNGSVAAQLAHRQHRPVVVVPLDPITFDEADRQEKDSDAVAAATAATSAAVAGS